MGKNEENDKWINSMISYLQDDDPKLWEKVKDHILDWPEEEEDEEGNFIVPLCKKCGKEAVQKMNMLWVCPEVYNIPDKYFHPG